MYGREERYVFSKIHPGDGKTFMMILLANAHAAIGEKSTLVVTDSMLYDQLLGYTEIHCDQEMVNIKMITDVTLAVTTNRIVILDEVDLIIDKFACVFEDE